MKNITKILKPYDEHSKKFKNALLKSKIEIETTPIKPFYSSLDSYIREYKKCYFYVDTSVYKNIKQILSKVNASSGLNDIAFILKRNYYKLILLELNFDSIQEFNTSFNDLNKFLEKEISAIRFESQKKGQSNLKIWHPDLVKIITDSYKIFLLQNGVTLTTLNQQGKLKSTVLFTDLQDQACLQMVAYLQSNTECIYNSSIEDAKKGKFSNKFCNLIHELLVAANIINDTKTDSTSAYVRNKINRAIKKEPTILEHFILSKTDIPLSFASIFPDANYFQALIDTSSKFRKELKQK